MGGNLKQCHLKNVGNNHFKTAHHHHFGGHQQKHGFGHHDDAKDATNCNHEAKDPLSELPVMKHDIIVQSKEANDADNEGPNTKPEEKYRVVDMLCLPGNLHVLEYEVLTTLLYLIMMTIHAESNGTARADTTPRTSYTSSSPSAIP